MSEHNINWGTPLIPTPAKRVLKFEEIQNEFCLIGVSTNVTSTLKLSNLTASDKFHVLVNKQGEKPTLQVDTQSTFVAYGVQKKFVQANTYILLELNSFDASAVKFGSGKHRINIALDEPVPIRLIGSESNMLFDDVLEGDLEFEYEGEWLAIETRTQLPATVRIISNGIT